MTVRAVPMLPDPQLAPLLRAYRDASAARNRRAAAALLAAMLAFAVAAWGAEADISRLLGHIGNFADYFIRIAHLDSGAPVWTSPAEWFWGLGRWLRLLGETVMIAYAGTLAGVIGAFCASFLTSRALVRSAVLRAGVRRVLEFCRTVPDLVFAMVFVVAFGLGALPGVLAIAVHTAGTLGKLFAEVVETIDLKPVEGIAATGGGWFARIRYGVVPQVLSNFASYALLRFEINVRGAAVIGFVGAGGIGMDLLVAIRKFYYSDVSAMMLLIAAAVMLIDTLSARLRHRILATEGAPGRGWPWIAAGLALFAAALAALGISPLRILQGAGRMADIAGLMWPPLAGDWAKVRLYAAALGQTLAIAFLGTMLAAILAFPAGFLAARNVVASRALHLLARRALDTIRSIDTLVWALIWINVVGLGPFAGALAIMCTDFAAFAKVMSEAVETADRRPIEGIIATGGSRLAAIRFGILPQVLPVFASQVLYFYESNVRSATIIGIVGAGGIGLWLSEAIRVLEWNDAAFIIALVLIAVAAIDQVSQRLRAGIIGRRT